MKRTIVILIVILIGGTIGFWKISRARRFQFFGELVSRVGTADSVVALTFDDGPTPAYTDTVLALLRDRQVKATFFLTGRETEANPEQARHIAAEGHELGNHTFSHPTMLFKSPARIREEVERTDAALRDAGQQGEIYFRPPFAKKFIGLPFYLARTHRTTVMWDIEPESYREVASEADRIVKHVIERVRPGSIILLHVMYQSRQTSREALPGIIDGLREKGYRFATVSELIGRD